VADRTSEQLSAVALVCTLTPSPDESSSQVLAGQVLERLDAELSEKDEQGRPVMFGKVAIGAIVGNEDGAHHITGVLFQALNDVGFTVPAQGVTYWNGEAMSGTDYKDLDHPPDAVRSTIKTVSANASHLARALKQSEYPRQ
jgi:hypothetical protein